MQLTRPSPSARIGDVDSVQDGPARIVLLTDFGWQDTYVGVMKGVISWIAPEAVIIDLTHAIPQGNLKQTAYKLWQAVPYFPKGTIYVIVVDPGVGTTRRAIGVEWGSSIFIAPDNGVLSYLLAKAPMQRAFELSNPSYQRHPVSSTFHGRDIFAPAGAHLAAGEPLEAFGEQLQELVQFDAPRLQQTSTGSLEGEVVHIDRFGNAISSIGRLQTNADEMELKPWLGQLGPQNLPPAHEILLPSGERLPLSPTFGAVAAGNPVAYLGSEQLLEIAINGGSAAKQLGLAVGDPIKLRFRG